MSSTETAAGGLQHTASFYGSDEQFVDLAGSFCERAVAADEPVVVRVEARKSQLLRSRLPSARRMTFLPRASEYESPAGAFASTVELCRRHGRDEGTRLHLLGELPALRGLARDAWMRYEAAVNHVLGDCPVHALCAFDERTTADPARAEILRTHHDVLGDDGDRTASALYQHPAAFVAHGRHPARDPLEGRDPDVEMTDPAPSAARQAVTGLAGQVRLDRGAADNLVTGVSEVLANAIVHGRPPVSLQGWGAPGRVVVAVSDRGTGPAQPFVGVVPVDAVMPEGGLGLWIAHQLCPEIALRTGEDGFTVRLAAGGA